MDVYKVERTDDAERFCCDFKSAIVIAHSERDAIDLIASVESFIERGVEPDGSNLMASLLATEGRQLVMTHLSGGGHN